ncbi:MAG TPA: hypothetical protein VFD21_11205 [Vicinamibacterales bacterium]|jgi:hypothetical protein|nr:hypothetical protein [Vicinamibacterales bacterium]
MRLLALFLALTMTGPAVTSLVCDWACAAKHQVVTASVGGCHEHGTDASTPTMARGHQCHEVSTAPESVLTSTPQVPGLVDVADPSLAIEASARQRNRSADHLQSPFHAPPPLLIPLRI